MAIEHKDITESNLHEPKGVSTASSGQVYVADGAGSGTQELPKLEGQAAADLDQIPISNGAGGIEWDYHPTVTLGRIDLIDSSDTFAITGADIRLSASYTDITPSFSVAITSGGFLANGTNHLIIPRDGVYRISTWISVSSSAASSPTLAMDLNVNGVSAFPGSAIVTSLQKDANDVVELVGFGEGSFEAGDIIGLGFASSGTTTLSVYDSVFSAVQIGR